MSKLEPDISNSSILRGGVNERGSLDQQLKGRWKIESGNDPEACEDRVLMMRRQRVREKTKTEDSTPKTSSTSKGESVGALNVC